MKAVVTGGAGFIGSNLAAKLLSEGMDVIVIDNFSTGSQEMADILAERGAEIIRGNSSEIINVRGVDVIFHLGMPSSSPMYKENPSLLSEVIRDAVQVLEYARKQGIRIVYASTSSLYNGHDPPHREDMAVFPTDFYTEARYWLERLAKVYYDLYGVKSIGLRLFSVYGPNERPKGRFANVASQMVWAALKGEPFIIYGDGTQTRDFIYVTDVVNAFELAFRSEIEYGIYNVGTGIETSFNELASRISKVLGQELKLKYRENPIKNYVYRTQADITKAKKELSFEPKVSLEEGLKSIVSAYREDRTRLAY